uniref:Uncharacterized protein n=1 Tax=Panagrolaimus sp. JU765 TaxID=591449 RepID=A0AC34QQZ1_9BILA
MAEKSPETESEAAVIGWSWLINHPPNQSQDSVDDETDDDDLEEFVDLTIPLKSEAETVDEKRVVDECPNLEKRPKWERYRGLSVGEFLREIESESPTDEEQVDDGDSFKSSMHCLDSTDDDFSE